jgi:hypothetical protein
MLSFYEVPKDYANKIADAALKGRSMVKGKARGSHFARGSGKDAPHVPTSRVLSGDVPLKSVCACFEGCVLAGLGANNDNPVMSDEYRNLTDAYFRVYGGTPVDDNDDLGLTIFQIAQRVRKIGGVKVFPGGA